MTELAQTVLLAITLITIISLIYKMKIKKDIVLLGVIIPRLILVGEIITGLNGLYVDSFVLHLSILLVFSSDLLLGLSGIFSKQYKVEYIATNHIATLQDLQYKLDFIVNHIPIGIFVISRTGKFEFVNNGMVELTEYSNKELLEMSVFDLMPDTTTLGNKRRMRTALETLEKEVELVMSLSTKSGKQKRIKLNAKKTVNGHETITGSVYNLGE